MPKQDGKLIIQALDSLWEKYQKRLKRCRHQASEEAVHKLRISTRRLLALIQLLRVLAPQPALGKLRKALKTQLDGFDQLRDTQVMLLEISAAITKFPQLQPFLQHLQLSEQQLLLKIPAFLQNLDTAKLDRKLQKIRSHCQNEITKTSLSHSVSAAIDAAYQTTLDRYQNLDPAKPASIHHLRIAVKKLRYMLSAAQTLLPNLPANHLQRLQQYLTRMGEIQNSTVLLTHLQQFFADKLPEPLDQYFQQRHRDLLNDFMLHRDEIFQFWRADVDQTFPWQTQT